MFYQSTEPEKKLLPFLPHSIMFSFGSSDFQKLNIILLMATNFFIKKRSRMVLKEKYIDKFQYLMKISEKMSMFLKDTLGKTPHNCFAYFSVSEHSAYFLFSKEKLFWLGTGD